MSTEDIVKNEAMHWGDEVADSYHSAAERTMDGQWALYLAPLLTKHKADLTTSLDFAVGRGRNTRKLFEAGAASVTVVDVNQDNIDYCAKRFVDKQIRLVHNNGIDLSNIEDGGHTLVYSWDAMVHFDPLLVGGYVAEFYRVLKPGGTCLVHHSNFSANPGADFRTNPHWRNYMTADLFKHFAMRAGFRVLEQKLIPWELPDIDCISVLRKA